jgi:hypothetical protein
MNMVERLVREFGGIRIDTREWPIIIWESPERRLPDAAPAEALDYLVELMRATPPGVKTFSLTDLSRVKEAPPASQRKYAANHMERTRALQRRVCAGSAIVVTSAIVRGVITAVFWLKPPPVISKMVASREEGLRFGIDLLAAAAPPLPQNLRELRDRLDRLAVG